jgi:hypothetical protein
MKSAHRLALGALIVILAGLLFTAMHSIPRAHGAEPILTGPIRVGAPLPQRPYSCRLVDAAERKCAFGQCDKREIERLKKECPPDQPRAP